MEPNSQNQPEPKSTQQPSPNNQRGTEEAPKESDRNSTDWWMFGATVGIGLIGLLQLVAFICQARYMRRSAEEMEKTTTATIAAANATKAASDDSAKFGRQIERAYVTGGWGRHIDGRLQANINNDGKTPAMVHHMALAILPLAGLPPTPSDLPRHYVEYNIPPYGRGILADHVSVDWDGNYTPDRVLYGRFWYRDIFGDEHESGFLLHKPGGAAVAGFPKYWYWT